MNSSALLTDLYQLTMANGYFKLGMHNKHACFQHFFRKAPFGSGFTIAAGFGTALEYLDNFRFTSQDVSYLSSLKTISGSQLFDREFLEYLQGLKLEVTVEAMAEGTVVFPREPLLRIRGPILQCQILETPLLNMINFQTLIATKAARCVNAAKGREIIDFGLRRAQGPNGGVSASRAAFIGGCSSTTNVLAGNVHEISVRGTLAHSWIMAFGDEKTAFRAFAKTMPDSIILLVDTYHTRTGIENAIEVGREIQAQGHKLLGIRLDSGDLNELSKMARSMLDEAGFYETRITASSDLDEHKIASLVSQGAPIDTFGVGTRMVTAFDEPALGGVYKLAAIFEDGHWKNCAKISDDHEKSTLPGLLQTRRFIKEGQFAGDLIASENETRIPETQEWEGASSSVLFETIMTRGKSEKIPTLKEAQERARAQLGALDARYLALESPALYPVWIHPNLKEQQQILRQEYP